MSYIPKCRRVPGTLIKPLTFGVLDTLKVYKVPEYGWKRPKNCTRCYTWIRATVDKSGGELGGQNQVTSIWIAGSCCFLLARASHFGGTLLLSHTSDAQWPWEKRASFLGWLSLKGNPSRKKRNQGATGQLGHPVNSLETR